MRPPLLLTLMAAKLPAARFIIPRKNQMSKTSNLLKHEFLQLIGPTAFFFVAFSVLLFTKKLFLEDYHITVSGFFLRGVIGALLVGKVVLLADELLIINPFPRTPLIFSVAWKAILYSLAALVVQFLEELLPLFWQRRSLVSAATVVWDRVHWPHFWAVHILLSYFLLIYVSFRELARTLGEENFFHIFFGLPRPTPSGLGKNAAYNQENRPSHDNDTTISTG